MRRRLALPLLVGLLAAVWAGPAAAAPRGRAPAGAGPDITLHWNGTAWAEVPPDHPAVRKPAGDEGRDVTLYWNGAAWVELLPGVELRYSHLTDSSREVADAPDADRVRAASASSVADDAGAGRARPTRPPTAAAHAASAAPAWAGVGAGPSGDGAADAGPDSRGAGAALAAGGVTTEVTPPPTPAASAAEQSTSASISLVGDLHDGLTRTGSSFQFASLRDLRILVDWTSLPGAANVQRVEVRGPDGNLYQRFTTPIAATHMETRLPVGGTWITQHELVGAWRVQVYLNKDASPVTTQSFQLSR
ncbi:MAG: hypothetical protein A3E31_02325 [Candidatus Rokubacteria bacterium RIFCSPHIGHO2_12_FULL_73_22]|nr:MAG: hypothetical protein A3E31_02325 [Candidatus Rokubacteria bacterium RIFCSPHIGHO2_12_FULL_73_22]